MKANAERTITATPNHQQRTFTIRIKYANGGRTKYRTTRMDAEEFQSCLHNTEKDWGHFLSSTGDYYTV